MLAQKDPDDFDRLRELREARESIERAVDFSTVIPKDGDADPLCEIHCAIEHAIDLVLIELTRIGGLTPSAARNAAFALMLAVEAKLIDLDGIEASVRRLRRIGFQPDSVRPETGADRWIERHWPVRIRARNMRAAMSRRPSTDGGPRRGRKGQ